MAEKALLFMKLTTDKSVAIKGEAEAEGFEEQIVLDDWSWRIGRLASDGSASGASGRASSDNPQLGEVDPEVFSFSKPIDRATTAMLSALTSGQLLEAEITLEEQSETEFEMVIKLSKVRIIKYELEGEVDDDFGEVQEKWVFNFEDLKILYKPSTKGVLTFEVARNPSSSTEVSSSGVDTNAMKKDMKSLGQKETTSLFKDVFGDGPV